MRVAIDAKVFQRSTCDDGFRNCANECGNAGKFKDISEQEVRCGIDSVEDQGEMWKEFGDDIKCTYGRENTSLDTGIKITCLPQTVQRMNSMLESGSPLTLIVIAA